MTKLPSGESGALRARPPAVLAFDAHAVGQRLAAPGRQRPTTNGSRSAVTDGCSMRSGETGGRRRRARGRRRVQPDAARVERGAARDDRHRIDAGGDAAAEQVADARPQRGHQRRPADQHHARDVAGRVLVPGEQALHRGQAARDERRRQRVQLVARDVDLQIGAAAVDRRTRTARSSRARRATARSWPARRRSAAAPAAGARAGSSDRPGRPLPAPGERRGRPLDQRAVDVLAAQEVVAGVIEHAQPAVASSRAARRPASRRRGRTPASVPRRDVGAPAGGDRAGDRLLDQDHLFEPRQPARPRGGVVLRQLEQRRRRDHGRPRRRTRRRRARRPAATRAPPPTAPRAAAPRPPPRTAGARRCPSGASTRRACSPDRRRAPEPPAGRPSAHPARRRGPPTASASRRPRW